MSEFVGYNGEAFSPAGDKGRYVLPPDFRNGIKLASGGVKTVCLARHPEWKNGWKCLIGFGVNYAKELEAQLAHDEDMAARRGDPFDIHQRRRSLFNYRTVPFDDSGRFVLPESLKKRAKIDSGLYLNGMGTYFTIWAPEMLDELGEEFEDLLLDCEDAIAEAETKSRKRGA